MDTVEKYQRYVITSCVKGIEPVVIDHGRGATVTDTEGRNYIDCFGGISVVNAGHCNEQVNAAATAKVKNYCREHGILLGTGGVFGNVIRFQPPLVITEEEIERAVDTIDRALASVA